MTQQFFPPDVSVRLRGDRAAAQLHFKDARRLLFKALNIGNNPASLIEHFDDGSTIHVLLLGNQKIVTIYAERPVSEKVEFPEYTPPTPPFSTSPRLIMLSGWTRTHTVVAGAMHEFEPSPAIIRAYDFDSGWQDVVQLNTTGGLQVSTIRPGQYSGAMKRVVQAMLGVGMYTDESPSYLTGTVTTGERAMVVNYNYRWSVTHGIYKAAPQNHWVIEVSLTNGMLAMPLITIPFTRLAAFREHLVDAGDTDTLKVVDEFGGIPSGLAMPAGSALTTALAQGKVIQLMTPAQVAPFYTSRLAYHSGCGWAFPETGTSLHNTNWHTTPEGSQIALFGEHWRIDFSLSAHDIEAPFRNPAEPVGSGSASLTLVRRGRISYSGFSTLAIPWGTEFRELARTSLAGSSSNYVTYPGGDGIPWPGAELSEWGIDAFVCFDGDRLERVKWVPRVTLNYGRGAMLEIVNVPGPSGAGVCGYSDQQRYMIESPFFRQILGAREQFSPEAYASGSIDVRRPCMTIQRPPRAFRSAPYGSGLSDAYITSAVAATQPYPNDRDINGCFLYYAVPKDLSALTYGTGDQGLAFSYGNGQRISTTLCLLHYAREGYAIAVQEVEEYPSNPETDLNVVGAVDYDDYGLAFIPGQGVQRVAIPQYYGRSVGSDSPARFMVQVSARKTEYHRDAEFIFPSLTAARPVTTSTGATGMTTTPPEKMNWVGAPD